MFKVFECLFQHLNASIYELLPDTKHQQGLGLFFMAVLAHRGHTT
uniref:Uncharacterized protein n=1 Tax=Anguilla anguilla TaxID=7936 RepID=A0A0E9VNP7_ANGAN